MKIADAASALTRYDERRDPDDHVLDRVLPEEPGFVHAVVGGLPRTPREPLFLDSWQRERAACGRSVKVLLPQRFDNTDPDACKACADSMGERERDPEAWAAAELERTLAARKRSRRQYDQEQKEARETLADRERDVYVDDDDDDDHILGIVNGEVFRS